MYGLIAAAVVVVVILAIAGYIIAIYNRLVALEQRCENSFSQIDVQLKRRHDLIPNLVETAKGYMSHEKETLEAVLQARAEATKVQVELNGSPQDAAKVKQLAQSEGALDSALGRLMAVAENYPDLKANQNMMQLSEELTSTENKVAFARQAYNDSVSTYNTYRESFPPILLAPAFGKDEMAYYEIPDEAQREAPSVSFS